MTDVIKLISQADYPKAVGLKNKKLAKIRKKHKEN